MMNYAHSIFEKVFLSMFYDLLDNSQNELNSGNFVATLYIK